MVQKFIKNIQNIFELHIKQTDFYERDEDYQTFFDYIELGNSENEKAVLFRKLQDIARDKSLTLDVEDGLKDPITNRVLVDVETKEPAQQLFKYLDVEGLSKKPIRNITIDDIIKVSNQVDSFDGDDTNEFTLVVTSDPSNPADANSSIQLFNNILFSVKASVSNAGKTSGDSGMYTNKYKVFSPKDVDRDNVVDLINKNKGLLKDVGIKTVDVVDD